MTIFSNMAEKFIKAFMDDFLVFSETYDLCLLNLAKVLQRCVETNLVLNWEKCHFMIKEGIMLGHNVSIQGIEEDQAKIKAIKKLPPPTLVKLFEAFWVMRDFTRDLSKTS